jgi:glutaredoxin
MSKRKGRLKMNSHDEQTIREWALRQTVVTTIMTARGQGAADAPLAAFCERFKALVPDVRVRNAPEESFRVPAMIIGRHANIAYQAVPEGKELPPFLEALSAAVAPELPQSEKPLTAMVLPAELTLFISMQCPHCPHSVRQLTALAESSPRLRVSIVDGVLFDQEAKVHAIRSVPTLILDNRMRWVGRIDMDEVLNQCTRRDPADLSPGSLRQMLEAGDAGPAAALMVQNNKIFPALLELLMHERWSVRLGAMVTMEYLTDQAPLLAARAVKPLWERFSQASESVQGDVVHVLGQIDSEVAVFCLQQIAAGKFADSVKQAAAEELAG